jgi:hypothetical protein
VTQGEIIVSRKEFHASFKPKKHFVARDKAMCPVQYVCDICDQKIIGRVYFFEFEDDGDLPGRKVVVCDDCRATAIEYRGAIKLRPSTIIQ